MNIGAFLIRFINKLYSIINFVILMRVILSWIPMARNSFTNLIYTLTEPLLAPFRKILPNISIDFSPILLFFVIGLVRNALIRLVLMIFG